MYFATDDADAAAATAIENGGSVLLPAEDFGPLGRSAVLADPTGAPFGIWQGGLHIGAGIVNEPGGLTWEDLRSTDPDGARTFYGALIGYRMDRLAMAGPDYVLVARGEGAAGRDRRNDGAGRAAVLLAGVLRGGRCRSRGRRCGTGPAGRSSCAKIDTPFGPMAGLMDPAGAVFWVVRTRGNDPDRSG